MISPSTAQTPEPSAEPLREIEGYWIQNTTREGLCSDSPRIIGFDWSHNRVYIGGDGAEICFLDYRGLEQWPYEYGSPLFGFPRWISVGIPGLRSVTGATDMRPPIPAAYRMPSFAGIGGRCVLTTEELGQEPQWRCVTEADGIPFNAILGYGISRESGVEWFMSRDRVASYGLSPNEQSYSISELTGSSEARFTWLSVGRTDRGGVWVGTNGYGVVHIEPLIERATRYTLEDGLPNEDVRDVQTCGEDCVWIATAGGIGFWNGTTWTTYSVSDGLPSNDVRGISPGFIDLQTSSRLATWAATAEGAAVRLEGSERWQSLPDLPVGVEVNGVVDGVFSTRGYGLFQFHPAPVINGETTTLTVRNGLPSNHVTAMAATANGVLVGTPSGAVEGTAQAWVKITTAPVNDVSSTAIATEGGLWVWTSGRWVQASDERVTLVTEGGWYATPYQVCQWRDGQAPYCPTSSDGRSIVARALHSVPEQGIVIAVDDDSLWIIQAQEFNAEYSVSSVSLRSLEYSSSSQINDVAFLHQVVEGVDSNVWLLATEEGVYETYGQFELVFADGSLAWGWPVNVHRITVNQETGEVWIVTNQGAFTWGSERYWAYVAGLPTAELTAVLLASDGSVWFGTTDVGLIHFVPTDE